MGGDTRPLSEPAAPPVATHHRQSECDGYSYWMRAAETEVAEKRPAARPGQGQGVSPPQGAAVSNSTIEQTPTGVRGTSIEGAARTSARRLDMQPATCTKHATACTPDVIFGHPAFLIRLRRARCATTETLDDASLLVPGSSLHARIVTFPSGWGQRLRGTVPAASRLSSSSSASSPSPRRGRGRRRGWAGGNGCVSPILPQPCLRCARGLDEIEECSRSSSVALLQTFRLHTAVDAADLDFVCCTPYHRRFMHC